VLCGPAAERWLAGEFYAYLAEELPPTLTCWGEDETTDITVYRTDRGEESWKHGRVASIELKVVYRQYGRGSTEGRIRELCRQVQQAGPDGACEMNMGLLFGVFVRRPNRTFRERRTLGEFRRSLLQHAKPICTGAGAPLKKPTFETFISDPSNEDNELKVKIGGVNAGFGLVGQYLTYCP
jgi:hypothetical protein